MNDPTTFKTLNCLIIHSRMVRSSGRGMNYELGWFNDIFDYFV